MTEKKNGSIQDDDEKSTLKHPAFGNITISRVSGQAVLHDSPLRHHYFLALRISTEEVDRHLNRNWHHQREQIVEVYLSEAQFAQAITSLNAGGGTPCTLSYYTKPGTGEVLRPKLTDVAQIRQTFDAELQAKVDDLAKKVNEVQRDLAAALEHKSVPQKVKEAALEVVKRIEYVVNNLPFVQHQFVRAMDQAESASKTEVVALANALVTQKGLEALGVKQVDLTGEVDVKRLPEP